MQKLSDTSVFKDKIKIILEGFDPISSAGFTQIPNYLLNDPDLSASAKIVYSKLLSYAWHNNAVYPGQETMAAEIGLARTTVIRSLQELEKSNWIESKRRGLGKTNVYILKYRIIPKK